MDFTPRMRCGLRMMVALAAEPLRPLSAEALATVAKVPLGLARRTLEPLREALLVQAVQSGYRLGFHRRAIHVSDIVDALATVRFSDTCPLGACKRTSRCALCWALVEADVAASQVLHRLTLVDLVGLVDTQNVRDRADLAG